jgi:hypothetical protein
LSAAPSYLARNVSATPQPPTACFSPGLRNTRVPVARFQRAFLCTPPRRGCKGGHSQSEGASASLLEPALASSKPCTTAEALQEATLKRAVSTFHRSTHPRSSGVQRGARQGGLNATWFSRLPAGVATNKKAAHVPRGPPLPCLCVLSTYRCRSVLCREGGVCRAGCPAYLGCGRSLWARQAAPLPYRWFSVRVGVRF